MNSQLQEWAAARRKTLPQMGPVHIRDITPTVRDFTQAVSTRKGPLAVILELSRRTLEEGPLSTPLDLDAWMTRADQASVSALAVGTDAWASHGSPEDLRHVARGPLPVIAKDLVLTREQVYQARLFGADAVLLHAGAVQAPELKTFIEIAASMHMASAVEVESAEETHKALASSARILTVSCFGANGALELGRFHDVARAASPSTVLIARGPFLAPETLELVRGKADGLWVGAPLLSQPDPDAFLPLWVERAENGPA